MSHECHAVGCSTAVPPKMLMCARHWRMVSRKAQVAVWRTYRPGQEVRKDPSPEYMTAQRAAVDAVRRAEGLCAECHKATDPADRCPLCGSHVVHGFGLTGGGFGPYELCGADGCEYYKKTPLAADEE